MMKNDKAIMGRLTAPHDGFQFVYTYGVLINETLSRSLLQCRSKA